MIIHETDLECHDKLPGVKQMLEHNYNWDQPLLNPIQPMNEYGPCSEPSYSRSPSRSSSHFRDDVAHTLVQHDSSPVLQDLLATPTSYIPDTDSPESIVVTDTESVIYSAQIQPFSLAGFELQEMGTFEFTENTPFIYRLVKSFFDNCTTIEEARDIIKMRFYESNPNRKHYPREQSTKKQRPRSAGNEAREECHRVRKSRISNNNHMNKERERRDAHRVLQSALHKTVPEICHILAAALIKTRDMINKWEADHQLWLEKQCGPPPPELPPYDELFEENFIKCSSKTLSRKDKTPGKNEQYIASLCVSQVWPMLQQIQDWIAITLLKLLELCYEQNGGKLTGVGESTRNQRDQRLQTHRSLRSQTTIAFHGIRHDLPFMGVKCQSTRDEQTRVQTPPTTPSTDTSNSSEDDYDE